MAKTSPQSTAILTLHVVDGDQHFSATGRESIVLDLYREWLTKNPRLREMTAQLTQSADALAQAITRANKEQ